MAKSSKQVQRLTLFLPSALEFVHILHFHTLTTHECVCWLFQFWQIKHFSLSRGLGSHSQGIKKFELCFTCFNMPRTHYSHEMT